MYNEGVGVDQDYAEAARWWLKAAEQGNHDAQLNYGIFCSLGRGVEKSFLKAHVMFSLAAWGTTGKQHTKALELRTRLLST